MKQIIFSFPDDKQLSEKIAAGIACEQGQMTLRNFPDGESYVRVLSDVKDKDVVIICTLNRPDTKLLQLYFLCNLLKDQKAKSICLVAPYLSYMRQDKAFNPGEAITSEYFARLVSSFVDSLITIDPHLHRRESLNEIYSLPSVSLHAADTIASWIKSNIPDALLIGPDSESKQWVSEIAKNAGVPYTVSDKIRRGDSDVEISLPDIEMYKSKVPVLVDDIISTAHTMIETVKKIVNAGMKEPVCIGVHAVFAGNSYQDLVKSGVRQIVTCNTISHESNAIDISDIIIKQLSKHISVPLNN